MLMLEPRLTQSSTLRLLPYVNYPKMLTLLPKLPTLLIDSPLPRVAKFNTERVEDIFTLPKMLQVEPPETADLIDRLLPR
jgi:hypothetical protein